MFLVIRKPVAVLAQSTRYHSEISVDSLEEKVDPNLAGEFRVQYQGMEEGTAKVSFLTQCIIRI